MCRGFLMSNWSLLVVFCHSQMQPEFTLILLRSEDSVTPEYHPLSLLRLLLVPWTPRPHRAPWSPCGSPWLGDSVLGVCQASLELSVFVQLALALERGRSLSFFWSSDSMFWFRVNLFMGWLRGKVHSLQGSPHLSPWDCGLASVGLTKQ